LSRSRFFLSRLFVTISASLGQDVLIRSSCYISYVWIHKHTHK